VQFLFAFKVLLLRNCLHLVIPVIYVAVCFLQFLQIYFYSVWRFYALKRPSVTRVDQAKTVQARITKFLPSAARKTLVL